MSGGFPPVWLDGRVVDAADAQVSVFTHALHYGTGAFDGSRFYRTPDGRSAIFRLDDHLRRLRESAAALGMSLPFPDATLREACREVVRRSGLAEGYLRQLAFFGDGAMGIGAVNPVRVAVLAWRPAPAPDHPLRLRIAGPAHGAAWLPGTKLSGPYVRAFVARREAERGGWDDAVFTGPDGAIAEATGANVFVVRAGALATPPRSAPLLPGITRDSVLALAARAGIPAAEIPVSREALLEADEVFLCSSAGELRPVGTIEDRTLPAPGPITHRLAGLYQAAIHGRDPASAHWLELA